MYETVKADIEQTLQTLIATELGGLQEELQPETEIATIPNIESIKVLRIVTRIEQTYKIELPDNVVFQIRTFGELTDAVLARVDEAATAALAAS